MALIEAQVAVALDSTLPRDRIISVLHFNAHDIDPVAGIDYNQLATDLDAIWRSNWGRPAGTQEQQVTLYDLDDPKPRAPRAQVVTSKGAAPNSNLPREVALCLSFYSERNLPRNRGRIYLSPAARGLSSLGARPSATNMSDALAMADAFSGLGGVNIDWCVRSVMDNQFKKVTHAFVDDEWDTVRKRGLRKTTRQEHDVSG
jgi:hypothetical protein